MKNKKGKIERCYMFNRYHLNIKDCDYSAEDIRHTVTLQRLKTIRNICIHILISIVGLSIGWLIGHLFM